MGVELIAKVTDPYERKARLFPALLAGLPIIVLVMLAYGSSSVFTSAVTVAVSCGGLYLLGNIARERGKQLEPALFEKWGGKPTTQLLRHRDRTIERPTKQRYHIFLSQKINLQFPCDAAAEAADPISSDEVYESAVRWLLNHTRDKKTFALLFEENIAYGFRRNSYGLKSIGVGSCIIAMMGVGMRELQTGVAGSAHLDFTAMSEASIVTLAVSALMLVTWTLFFSERAVRSAAYTYAESLLRACDRL